MRETVLLLHVAAESAGLLLGPLWLLARLRGRRGAATAAGYLAAVAVVAATGCALALTAPGLGWLVGSGVLTAALAGAGALARRRAWPHWPTLQPHLLGGSYVALTTGLLVAQTGSPAAWVLPSLVAQLPIALAKRRLAAAA
ncbi:hypothetical protein LY71_110164 [Geodermatophilus tzadiensis]|uniref:Integral membrane protein n=1 Tax=Geodermatophilus tzadiensis TaxID=1137988 RepID=A0A2T0TRC5_9ACTN|nr:hypothetical protein [Geodermatophilus tzadiensis]PRY48272.1 hypothetical protein LY71_110164 [Geodermatophilus tzadiensis]